MATLVPVDHDPFADDVVLPPANPAAPPEAVSRWVQDTARRLATIPQRAFQASESLRTGGDYDPAPVVDAAQLAMTGGMPFAARGALGIFGGRLAAQNLAAKGIDQPSLALKMAEHMDAQGLPKEDIYSVTSKMLEGTPYAGVSKGAEGKWRFEIPDNAAELGRQDEVPRLELAQQIFERSGVSRNLFASPRYRDLTDSSIKAADFERSKILPQPLAQVLSHPDIYQAYPSLETLGTRRENMIGIKGRYSPEMDQISFGNDQIEGNSALKAAANEQNQSTLLHEIQHAIQQRENFERGGSPDDFIYQNSPVFHARKPYETERDAYRRLAGEVEARNVQTRMHLTPEDRRASPPWTTEDVPRDQQIVRGVQLIPVDHTPDFE